MEFYSSCYWQQAQNRSALLLQQYVCEGTTVHFGCVCMGNDKDGRGAGYMTGQLLQWFRSLRLKRLVRSADRELARASVSMAGIVARTDRELSAANITGGSEDTALAGIFCVGERFFLFYRGAQEICLVNTCFGRVHIRRIGGSSALLCTEEGDLEKDVGLLFTVGTFREHITEQMIGEGLFVRELSTEAQMEKHLIELGEEAERRGGKNMAAVFLRTR